MTIDTCDEITCQRVGTLSAYGWSDGAIADALLLSQAQIDWAKSSEAFKANFNKYSVERVMRQQTVAEGWDAIEEKSLEVVAQALEYNRDPRFALQAARVANQAHRRSGGSGDRVINADRPNTVIVLQLGENFVRGKLASETSAVLDIKPRERKELPKRQADIPTPQAVSNLLTPVKQKRITGAEFLDGLDFVIEEK